jgi:hypothetical protein
MLTDAQFKYVFAAAVLIVVVAQLLIIFYFKKKLQNVEKRKFQLIVGVGGVIIILSTFWFVES